jgi:type I restriction enzyme M protein
MPASATAWTKRLWVYDHRTNIHHTLKTNPLQRTDLDDFVACFHAENRFQRKATWDAEKNADCRWRAFDYDELLKRDKVSLDVFWLKDEAQEDSASLPDPDVIAAEDLRAALEQFEAIAADLAPTS